MTVNRPVNPHLFNEEPHRHNFIHIELKPAILWDLSFISPCLNIIDTLLRAGVDSLICSGIANGIKDYTIFSEHSLQTFGKKKLIKLPGHALCL